MGRVVKRVLPYFVWPEELGTWPGYVNPFPGKPECGACGGTGFSAFARMLDGTFYSVSCRTKAWYERLQEWIQRGITPTADQVNASQNQRGTLGHDTINRYVLIEHRCDLVGEPYLCSACNGDGCVDHPDSTIQRLHDEWQPYEPPEGSGWQLWETTSEGSPCSPVFDTAEELAAWCVTGATIFGSDCMAYRDWLRFINGSAVEQGVGSTLMVSREYFGPVALRPETELENTQ